MTKKEDDALYLAELEGLAESKLAGKSQRQIEDDLVEISERYKTKISAVQTDLRTAFAKLMKSTKTNKQGNPPEKEPPEFSEAARERAAVLMDCSDRRAVFHNDFNATGIRSDQIKTGFAFLIAGARQINFRAIGKQKQSICGLQIGITGDSGEGKSAYQNHLVKFIDCAESPTRVTELSDCSAHYLAFKGGEDGRGLVNQHIKWDELKAPENAPYTHQMEIMWQTTTNGEYVKGTTVEGPDGKRIAVEYRLRGPLYHSFTTTDPPSAFEEQFRNRTFWMEINNTEDERAEILSDKLNDSVAQAQEAAKNQAIWESWNILIDSQRKVDPDNLEAFVDVDTSVLGKLFDKEKDKNKLGPGELRRVDLLIALVMCSAVLNQGNRTAIVRKDGRDVLVADERDVNAVLPVFLCCVPSGKQAGLKASQHAFLKIVGKLVSGELTEQELRIELGKKERCVRGYIKDWSEAGLIADEKKSGKSHYGLGPAMAKAINSLTPSSKDLFDDAIPKTEVATIEAVALDIFQNTGFSPSPLQYELEELPCSCPLHEKAADMQVHANANSTYPESSDSSGLHESMQVNSESALEGSVHAY